MSLKDDQHWALPAQLFVKQWLQGQKDFTINTSGSTGAPKTISIKREAMMASAQATIDTLELPEGLSALLCINASFIGGQMMLVRAMLRNWQIELNEPSLDFQSTAQRKQYNFTALVPLQIASAIKTPQGFDLLNNIDKVIIGGAGISESLISKLQDLKCACYHTYGMTETVSHIGLRRLNGPERSDWFKLTGDTEIELNELSCLRVKGAVTDDRWVNTNDLAEISGNKFKWLGRADLVVNSGGIKILIEQAELEINRLLPSELSGTIMLWKKPHEELGEELIGITSNELTLKFINDNRTELNEKMRKYSFPKIWLPIDVFRYTQSGKLDRKLTFEALGD